jgi:hypothetical protein
MGGLVWRKEHGPLVALPVVKVERTGVTGDLGQDLSGDR